ncbi:hypothetical protein [Aureimonas sp. AU20]|uniref:hypothetical protein n=1 Tax=Aureimonas sp. AU20 TaxID=1349819 RepID=UPI00071F4C97|nr:hypothetical protein [Aureimonas sp. AU20]ALN73012.1 hypothetical protein M673_09805 [Aureimonas sp. AU20]
MSSVSLIGSVAVQLLQEGALRATIATGASQARDGAGAANDRQLSGNSIFDPAASNAKARVADALFDTTTDQTQRKLALFEKTCDALGVRKDAFASDADYRAAIKDAFSKLKLQDDYPEIVQAIEENLGLTKLGVSLETVVNAILNPNGEGDKALTSALAIFDQLHPQTKPAGSRIRTLSIERLGLYRIGR